MKYNTVKVSGIYCLLLILAVGCAARAPVIEMSYFLAVKKTPAPGERSPSPNISEGAGWVNDTYVTPVGIRIPIVRKQEPEVTIPFTTIHSVLVYHPPWVLARSPSSTIVMTQLTVDRTVQQQLERLGQEYNTNYWLLVRSGGRILGLAAVSTNLADVISGGTFPSEQEATDFYSAIQSRVQVYSPSQEEIQRWADHDFALLGAGLWRLKCNSKFRAEAQRDGIDVSTLLDKWEDQIATIDCAREPPTWPDISGLQGFVTNSGRGSGSAAPE